jgi:hypothetical protein
MLLQISVYAIYCHLQVELVSEYDQLHTSPLLVLTKFGVKSFIVVTALQFRNSIAQV